MVSQTVLHRTGGGPLIFLHAGPTGVTAVFGLPSHERRGDTLEILGGLVHGGSGLVRLRPGA